MEAMLAKSKVKVMELYTRQEGSQDAIVRTSEYVVTCMIAADPPPPPPPPLVLHPSVINGVSAVLNAKAFAPCHTPAVAIA